MSEDSVVHISVPKAKKPALGRGMAALLGESRREEPLVAGSTDSAPTSGLASLPVSRIEPHPEQPRRRFDEAALDELAASIAQRGVIQPVIVTPHGEGRYRLVAGERRWRAAQKAQLHEIPAIVRELSDREITALALIENLQREDLNPIEEARAYHTLANRDHLSQVEIAAMVDKSRSHIANLQRLLVLPQDVLDMVEDEKLSMGHARALIGNQDASEIARAAVAKNLSVREVEKIVRVRTRGTTEPRRARATTRDPAEDADIAAVQSHLEEFLGLPVRIQADADPRSGAVTIRYRTLDQLDLICQRLTGGGI